MPGRPTAGTSTSTSSSSAPARAASAPRAAADPAYLPPLHGTNPHGQGTIGTIDLNPSDTRPLAGNPYEGQPGGDTPANQEEVILGRARGDYCSAGSWCAQQDPSQTNQYHGHITVLSLFGNEIVGVDTKQGQTHQGPLSALQTQVLDQLCTGSGGNLCVNVLTADSSTTSSGSTNHFAIANAKVGAGSNGGPPGLAVGAANSDGNIYQSNSDGTANPNGPCQHARGDSSAASVSAGGQAVADLLQSTSDSQACNNGTPPSQTNTSKVINLGGSGVPIPAPGCANGTPNTATGIPTLAPIICNADDPGTGGQAAYPYGVREALTVFLLQATPGNTGAAKITGAASESLAVAPAKATTPPSTTPTTPTNTTGPAKRTCPDSDRDCGAGPPGTGKCASDKIDQDGDCELPGNRGSEVCTDSDRDCGVGPAGTGKCPTDVTDSDGDCVLPNGSGRETGGVLGAGTTRFVSSTRGPAAAAPAAAVSKGGLPFTGYDLLPALLLGTVLLVGGLGLQRALRIWRRDAQR